MRGSALTWPKEQQGSEKKKETIGPGEPTELMPWAAASGGEWPKKTLKRLESRIRDREKTTAPGDRAKGQSNRKTLKEARSPGTESDEKDLDSPRRGKEDLISIPITAGKRNSGQGRKEVHPKGGFTCPSEQREGITMSLTAAGAESPSKMLIKQLGHQRHPTAQGKTLSVSGI